VHRRAPAHPGGTGRVRGALRYLHTRGVELVGSWISELEPFGLRALFSTIRPESVAAANWECSGAPRTLPWLWSCLCARRARVVALGGWWWRWCGPWAFTPCQSGLGLPWAGESRCVAGPLHGTVPPGPGASGQVPHTYCSLVLAQPARRQGSRSVVFAPGKTRISTDDKSRLIPGQGTLEMLTRNRSSTPKFSGI
jgi:hypothetical protein